MIGKQPTINNSNDIPNKTLKLIDRLAPPGERIKIGKPVTTNDPLKHSVAKLRGVWRVAPPPSEEQIDEMHLFRLTVMKNKSWKIDVTDLSTGSVINHCSGDGGLKTMNGQVYSGLELSGMQLRENPEMNSNHVMKEHH